MSSGLSARDLERISAYLDKTLSSREIIEFERRLKIEPVLARGVAEFENTRVLLRRVPQRNVPHSFAIKPEMVSTSQEKVWNFLNLVSAAATLVLVLVFAGDIWASGSLPFGAAAPSAEEAPQALMAEEAGAEDTALTPTFPSPADEGEFEGFAEREAIELETEAPFDFRSFFIEYGRPLEIVLGVIALAAGFTAWRRKHKT